MCLGTALWEATSIVITSRRSLAKLGSERRFFYYLVADILRDNYGRLYSIVLNVFKLSSCSIYILVPLNSLQ